MTSQVLTCLFTDIEGSTRRAVELGNERWARLLAEHRARLRHSFARHRGREVHAEGDALFLVFEHAEDAAAAALAGQRSLESAPWPDAECVRVRMGIHTGEVLIESGDYIGHEIHRAKRICDAAHGGQIVVSSRTADLLRRNPPPGATLLDLGQHRLKDGGGAQQLFQLCAADLPQVFPALRSLAGFRSNLPLQRSSFIGRGDDLGALAELFSQHRLITLTGVGGCGKTRLALEYATIALNRFRDGAVFVDLAAIGDPDLLVRTVASSAGITIGEGLDGRSGVALDLLLDCLALRHCLLIVDNCEHLLEPVAGLVERLLAECPHVTICATSREALAVDGEHSYPVTSLSLPEDDGALEASEAVRLFLERAHDARADFALAADDRHAVATICRRLDGMPLAIELAAARVDHLAPRQIADRLDDAFRLLAGGRRRIARQQTLEAALDWSHDLLRHDEQMLFRRLAVFTGTFDLNAAEHVCDDTQLQRSTVLDLLRSLMAKSLVTSGPSTGAMRYRLLETVRAYAAQRLRAADEADTFRGRHAEWYAQWLEAVPFGRMIFDHATISIVAMEIANVRSAADWSVACDQPALLVRLACPPLGVWWFGDRSDEGHRWLLHTLREPDRLLPEQRLYAHAVLAVTSMLRTEGTTLEHAACAIELAAGRPSAALVLAQAQRAIALTTTPASAADVSRAAAARDAAAQAIAAADTLPTIWLAFAQHMSAQVELTLGNVTDATECLAAAVAGCDRSGDCDVLAVWAQSNLSVCHHLQGHRAEALQTAQWARKTWHGISETVVRVTIPLELAPSLAAGGDWASARTELSDALRDPGRIEPLFLNTALILTGALAAVMGEFERAGRLLAAGRYLGGAADLPVPFRSPATLALYRHYIAVVRAELGPATAKSVQLEGRTMPISRASRHALDFLDA